MPLQLTISIHLMIYDDKYFMMINT